MSAVRQLLDAAHPGLYTRIEDVLVQAEARFNRGQNQGPSEHLLDHTRRTAAIARYLAEAEGVDALLPVLVALFHDTGKFHDGEYHKDGIPEEEHAAVLAERILPDFGVGTAALGQLTDSLRALYDDRLPCLGACRIVQDADRLDKLGALGVSTYFTKAALRGRGLVDALVQTASRELTYAEAAARSMFTASGKAMAARQAAKTVAFFDDLLADLEAFGIAAFERRDIHLDEAFTSRDGAQVHGMRVAIVMPRRCPDCGAELDLSHRRDRGIKCEKLTARFACRSCAYGPEISFCLPVLA